MTRILLAMIVVASAACATDSIPDAPTVAVIGDASDDIMAGAATWLQLGFSAQSGTVTDLPECARDWYVTGDTACVITVTVTLDPATAGGQTDIAGRHIWLHASEPSGWAMQALAGHEFGHLLLDTSRHIPGHNVMSGDRETDLASPADYQLACDTIGVCVRGAVHSDD